MIEFFLLPILAQSASDVIKFPIIGDWGGVDWIIFPTGYVPTQEFGANK